MKTAHFVGWLAAIALAGAATIAATPAGQFLVNPIPAVAAEAVASPHLKLISDEEGTGSGVHIGHGYVLTAAHVGTMKGLTAKDDTGKVHKLTLLWANTDYDVALMRMDDAASVAAAPLSCAPLSIGEHLRAYGNPLDVEYVYALGTVVGAPMKYLVWQSVVPVDMTIVHGMSGGGVVDDSGKVVGITVGVMLDGYSMVGFGYIVPSQVACTLMGRD